MKAYNYANLRKNNKKGKNVKMWKCEQLDLALKKPGEKKGEES